MNGIDVKIWMMKQPLKARDIAKGYGCDDGFVSNFLRGRKTSHGLADYLIELGCPQKYFKGGRVAA